MREYAQWVAEENAMREARKARDAERRREKEHKPAEVLPFPYVIKGVLWNNPSKELQ